MPSVRVRRNTYISLDDPFQLEVVQPSEQRGLTAILVPQPPDGQVLSPTADTPEAQAPAPSKAQPRPQTRSRASSRVVRHVQSLSMRAPPATTDGDPPFLGLQRLPSHTHSQKPGESSKLEGRQLDLSIRSGQEGQPGLVGSALSLPSESQPPENPDDIRDDVIEHLDVIGDYCPRTKVDG